MFTGIITNFGYVNLVTKNNQKDLLLVISSPKDKINRTLEIGCSIACNGICLTLIKKEEDKENYLLSFQASNETCNKTTLGSWQEKQEINLEFALRAGDELGGHMVLGHVDAIAKIEEIVKNKDSHIVKISSPQDLTKYIVPKGSITIDGVSLTVNEIDNNIFSLNIVNHTMQNTIFKNYQIGNFINLEIDVIARYIKKGSDPKGV